MPEITGRRRLLVLAICCTSLLVVTMDSTIVNVALPALRRDLDAEVAELQWTIDAYTLVLASFLMLAGSTADRVGRRRTFQVGLSVFGLGSLACSLAPTAEWLIAARVLQALGGAMLNPVAMSIITNTFTDRVERARAIGVWGAVAGVSLGVGPVLGGALVDSAGWRAVFWINVPIVLLAIAGTARYVPESRAARARRIDPIGQLLVMAALGGCVSGLIEGPRRGWSSAGVLAPTALAVVAVLALLVYEPRRADPLLELRFFRSVPFAGATVTAVAAFCAFGSFLFVNPLYLQDVRGLPALDAGLYMVPVAVLIVVLAPISGRIVGRWGTRWPMVVAGVATAASGVWLAQLTPTTPPSVLLGGYALFGIGVGMINPPITNSAVSGMPPSMAGVAASVASTSRQTGTALGVAVSGAIVGSALAQGPGPFTEASRQVWWMLAGIGVTIAALGVLTSTRRAQHTADRAAALFDDIDRVPATAR